MLYVYRHTCKKATSLGWGDGSGVKRTDCGFRGPEFKSQHPHGDSHPSIMRSGTQNTIYIINKFFLKKEKKLVTGSGGTCI